MMLRCEGEVKVQKRSETNERRIMTLLPGIECQGGVDGLEALALVIFAVVVILEVFVSHHKLTRGESF